MLFFVGYLWETYSCFYFGESWEIRMEYQGYVEMLNS